MANSENLFRRESMDQLSQQTKTGPYVSATRLMPWMTLVAVLILVLSFLIWAFAGKLPVTVSCKGFAPNTGNECILFLTPQQMQTYETDQGDDVRVTQPNGGILRGKVVGVSDKPHSQEEMSNIIESDWVFNEVAKADYNYYVTVKVNSPLQKEDLVEAVITVDHVRPIVLMINP